MTDSFARAGAWLLVQAAQAPDTRPDAAGRAGPGWFEKADGGRERADDDRAARAGGRAGAGRVELPEELREDQRPAGPGVRRHQPAHAPRERDRRQRELHHDVGADGRAAGERDDRGREPAAAAGGGADGAAARESSTRCSRWCRRRRRRCSSRRRRRCAGCAREPPRFTPRTRTTSTHRRVRRPTPEERRRWLRRSRPARSGGHASASPPADGETGRDAQYDLLTAALIGAAIGATATLLLRRGPSGQRPVAPVLRGAKWAGRGRVAAGADGRQAGHASTAASSSTDPDGRIEREVRDTVGEARERIDGLVQHELRDLRRALRRQRKRLGV